jgi:polycomb group RING finger protein 4
METVSISRNTTTALQELSDTISIQELEGLTTSFLKSLISGNPSANVSDEHEPYLRAISTVLLEATKNKASPEALAASLKESGINTGNNHFKLILETYATHGDTMLAHVEATGIAAPTLVDMQWRLDYSVRSKHGGRENVPMYFVTLKVKDRGIVRDIDMIASLEELQDMHARTKEAVKSVEAVTASAS